MKTIIVENKEEMDREAAEIVVLQLRAKFDTVLGLATGETPLGLYQKLVQKVRGGQVSFRQVVTFNLDEYVGLPPSHPQSYHYYMKEHLFSYVDVNPENVHLLNGVAEGLTQECEHYDRLIAEHGGIDLQVLGIGSNGHIGFNEPSEELMVGTHVVKLSEETRHANARFFTDISEVPTEALTMGVGSILQAKKIILLASGETKAPVIAKLFEGVVDTNIPASLLHVHKDVTIIVDRKATKYK